MTNCLNFAIRTSAFALRNGHVIGVFIGARLPKPDPDDSAVNQGGCVSNQGFSVMNQGFSVMNQGFSVMKKGFSVTDKGLSVMKKGFSMANRGRSGPANGVPED